MGRKGKRGQRQQQMKGFRPGKEPPQLRKQQAKARLGPDASWAQKQMVDAVGDRSPEAVQSMLRKWSLALVAAATTLVIVGFLLYGWSTIAGIVVHALAAVAFFLFYRMRRQQARLIEMAESIGGRRR